MTEQLTVDQTAEARTHAERMLRGWSPPALQWSQLGNAARIAMAFLQERALREEWAREGIDENYAIFTLTDVPREGFTLQQEIRAQHEELTARVDELEALLRRIHGWDHMDTAADGAYWRREIDSLLQPVPEGEVEPEGSDD